MKKSKAFLLILTLACTTLLLTSCGESAVEGGGIYTPFAWLLRVFYSWTGKNYALALLLFSLEIGRAHV